MFVEQLIDCLEEDEYLPLSGKAEGLYYFWKENEGKVQVVQVIEDAFFHNYNYSLLENNMYGMKSTFWKKGYFETDIFSVVFTGECEQAKKFMDKNEGYWIVDKNTGRMIIYEDQPSDFYGLREEIEAILDDINGIKAEHVSRPLKDVVKKVPVCTGVIIFINCLVHIILSIKGSTLDVEFMLDHGAMAVNEVIYQKQYFRLFTSMFLHFGLDHLMSNMVMLAVLGQSLEKIIGKWRFSVIYILSGLVGSAASLYYGYMNDEIAVAAGASGAVYGMLGSLFVVVLLNKGRIGAISSRKLLFLLAGSLYYAFISTGMSDYAHVGGAVGGMIFTFLLYRKPNPEHSPFIQN